MVSYHQHNVAVFKDNDQEFFRWLDNHGDGYFINSERTPKPTYLILHRSDGPHFDRSNDVRWTRDYIKICAPDRSELEERATTTAGGNVTHCGTCFG